MSFLQNDFILSRLPFLHFDYMRVVNAQHQSKLWQSGAFWNLTGLQFEKVEQYGRYILSVFKFCFGECSADIEQTFNALWQSRWRQNLWLPLHAFCVLADCLQLVNKYGNGDDPNQEAIDNCMICGTHLTPMNSSDANCRTLIEDLKKNVCYCRVSSVRWLKGELSHLLKWAQFEW